MKQRWKTPVITMSLFLSACATSDDPAQGGFFNGVSGLATGSYQRRVDVKEQQLYNEQSTQDVLLQRAADLRREREQVRVELNGANRQMASLNRSLRDYRRKLESEQRLRTGDEAQLQRAEAQLRDVQALAQRAEQEEQPVDDAREQVDEIRLRLSRLKDLVSELAGDAVQ